MNKSSPMPELSLQSLGITNESIPKVSSPLSQPCITSRGRTPNKLLILGEAPGESEQKRGIPFVGASGHELTRMLSEAGLELDSCYATNVLHTRPPNNKLIELTIDKKELASLNASALGYDLPVMKIDNKLRYLHPNFLPEIERLDREIDRCKPNLILALGNTALWALTGRQNISSVRGTALTGFHGIKILPTFHPAAVLRQWDLRPIVVTDFMKAKRQMEFPEIIRPSRKILTNVTISDITRWINTDLPNATLLSVDVETRLGQITEISFSVNPQSSLVVPFIRGFQENYFSFSEEVAALRLCREILDHPVPKLFQNGLYDIQYIWRTWKLPPRNVAEDTMLLHHSMYPEMAKGLGFLGSVYTDEPAWKLMRSKGSTVEKRDDE
jgi:uracil-DNA glycosylase